MERTVQRVFIRAARVCGGLGLALVGILCYSMSPDMSDVPFAALTLGMIFWGMVGIAAACLFACWAWLLAFGAGPS